MSGKTPINRLEGWRLSFHLCREERKKRAGRKTEQCGRNRMKWAVPGNTQHTLIHLRFQSAKRAKRATIKHTKQSSNEVKVWQTVGLFMHNRSSFFFFFYFCCVDNGAGWANRGAAHYLQGNSPSLNKHWLSACSCLIFAFICHICLKSFPLHRQKSENIVKKIFPKCSKCLKHRPETGRFTVRFIPLQIKTRRRLWLCGGFFFLFFFPSGRALSGELMCQFQDVPH